MKRLSSVFAVHGATAASHVAVPRARTIPQATVLMGSGYRFVVLAFNTEHPATNDVTVRRALEVAVDRRALLDKVDHGIGTLQQSFVPEQYSQYQAIPLSRYSISEASACLDAAGWSRGSDGTRAKNGRRLSIDLDTFVGAYPVDVELIRSWWTQIGVELNTKTFAPTVFYQPATGVKFGGQFDATIYSIQNSPFVYPSLIFGCNRIRPGGLNIPRFCDPHLHTMMADYESTYDGAKQRRVLTAIAKTIDDQVPVIVLSFPANGLVERTRLKAFKPNAITFFDEIMDVGI